jgi:DNA-binding PadR family transcriptional regulator
MLAKLEIGERSGYELGVKGYRTLYRMVDQGWLEKRDCKRNGRHLVLYSLTPVGAAALAEIRQRLLKSMGNA